MKKRRRINIAIVILVLASSCTNSGEPALVISGIADKVFSQKDLESMEMIDAEYINKDGERAIFTGIPISEILATAGVTKYSKLTITASDDYTAEIISQELSGCDSCTLSFIEGEGWKSVLSGFSGKLQVKDVVELNVE